MINRRGFLNVSTAGGFGLAFGANKTDFALPSYEAPLFDLHKF